MYKSIVDALNMGYNPVYVTQVIGASYNNGEIVHIENSLFKDLIKAKITTSNHNIICDLNFLIFHVFVVFIFIVVLLFILS